jgi:hypothetical protein
VAGDGWQIDAGIAARWVLVGLCVGVTATYVVMSERARGTAKESAIALSSANAAAASAAAAASSAAALAAAIPPPPSAVPCVPAPSTTVASAGGKAGPHRPTQIGGGGSPGAGDVDDAQMGAIMGMMGGMMGGGGGLPGAPSASPSGMPPMQDLMKGLGE